MTPSPSRRARPRVESLEGRDLLSFYFPVTVATGHNPQAVAVADFDADHIPDLAILDHQTADASAPGQVTIVLSNGDGSFKAAANLTTDFGTDPVALAAGDFNGDGKGDLAVVDGSTVRVFLGNGVFAGNGNGNANGAFTEQSSLNLSAAGSAVQVGDLNKDGHPDLVVSVRSADDVIVFLGNGNGTFQNPLSAPAGTAPSALTLTDVNGDGKLDAAVANATNPGGVSVLLGNGDGSFGPVGTFAGGLAPTSVAAGDFNGDGKTDLAVESSADSTAVSASATVSVFLGNGDGLFQGPVNSTVNPSFGAVGVPTGLGAGDFNGDGKLDLAATYQVNNHLFILHGTGTGAFPAPSGFGLPSPAFGIAVADVNRDGRPDVMTANYDADNACVFFDDTHVFATGADAGGGPHVLVYGTSPAASKVAPVLSFFAYNAGFTGGVRVAVGDVAGNGIPDVVTAPGPGGGPDVRVFEGLSGGMFREIIAYDPAFTGGVNVAVGDVNGDGFADIITAADAGGGPHVKVFSGKDGSLLTQMMAYDPAFTGGVRVAAGDVNGDGKADVITAPGPGGGPDVRVFDGATGAMIKEFNAFDAGFRGGVYLAAGDTDGDGKADIIAGAGAGGGPNVRVFSGKDGSKLLDFLAYDAGFTGGVRVAAADYLSFDTRPDILCAPGPSGGPEIHVFDGNSLGQGLDEFFPYNVNFTGGVYVGG